MAKRNRITPRHAAVIKSIVAANKRGDHVEARRLADMLPVWLIQEMHDYLVEVRDQNCGGAKQAQQD